MYAIECTFDPELDAALAAACDELAAEGFQTPIALGHRPHISLTVGDGLEHVDFTHLPADLPPLPEVTLAAAAAFPGPEGVVFAAPLPSRELLELHAAFFRYVHGIPVEHNPHYLPGAWMPHATLGMHMPADEVGVALEIVRPHLPVTGLIEHVVLAEVTRDRQPAPAVVLA